MKKADLIKAKEEFNEILNIDPKNKAATDMVVEIDNRLTQTAANRVDEMYIYATNLYKLGNYKEAKMYFEAVVVAAPHRIDAREFALRCQQTIDENEAEQRAAMLAKQQQLMSKEMASSYDKAMKSYEKADFESAYENLKKSEEIAVKYEYKEYLDNISVYMGLVKSALAEKHYKKGFDLFRRNNMEAAANEYKKSLEFNPDYSSARVELSRIGRDVAGRYYEQGMAYFSRSELDKAKEMFEKSLFYDPDKAEAKRALERIK